MGPCTEKYTREVRYHKTDPEKYTREVKDIINEVHINIPGGSK